MQTAATMIRGATYVLAPVVASDTVRTFCTVLYNVPAQQGFMSAVLFLCREGYAGDLWQDAIMVKAMAR